MNILQESSPRVAAHRQRTAEESLINKNGIIQRLSREVEFHKEAEFKFKKEINRLHGEIDGLKSKIIAYQSTSWSTRAWLLIRELFGHRTELI